MLMSVKTAMETYLWDTNWDYLYEQLPTGINHTVRLPLLNMGRTMWLPSHSNSPSIPIGRIDDANQR